MVATTARLAFSPTISGVVPRHIPGRHFCPPQAASLGILVRNGRSGTPSSSLARLRASSGGEEYEITDAIRQAEEKSVPFRAVRLQVYLVILAASIFIGGVIAADEAGTESVHLLSQTLPRLPAMFGASGSQNTEVVCALLTGITSYFLYAEEDTKQQNLKRIAEKVAEKRKEGTLGRPNKADGNRQERRLKKKAGEGVEATTPPPAKASGAPDADKAKKGAEQAGGGGGGLLDKIKSSELFKEADQMGRAQAIQLNSALEDAGVLEPIAGKSEEGGGGKQAKKKGSKRGKKKK